MRGNRYSRANNLRSGNRKLGRSVPRPSSRPTSPSAVEPPTPKAPGVVKEILGRIGLIGGVIFSAQFLIYDQFYGQLGLSPEDVGVNYVFLLVRSLGLALLLLPFVFEFVVVRTLFSSSGSRLFRQSRARPARWLTTYVILATLLFIDYVRISDYRSYSDALRNLFASLSLGAAVTMSGVALLFLVEMRRTRDG